MLGVVEPLAAVSAAVFELGVPPVPTEDRPLAMETARQNFHGPSVTVRLAIEGRVSVTVKVAVFDGAPEFAP